MWTILALLLACSSPEPPPAAEAPPEAPPPRLDVRAASYPAGWLARTVGGARVTVVDLLPPGEDPTIWQPDPALVTSLARADLVVANGAGFEAWMEMATLPASRVVYTASGVEDKITLEATTHTHGPAGAHSHEGIDPHTWSDPLTFLTQARVLRDALAALDGEHQAVYDRRLAGLEEDLRALDELLAAALAPAKGRPLAANHPAYNYLARRYGLELTSFGFDPQTPPTARQLQDFRAWAAAVGPEPVLLWEETPTEAVTATFPAGVIHLRVDPLEQPPEGREYDYLLQASANARALKAALAPPK